MPKKVDHDERRRQLVEASWDVICADGLEGVSLRRIADAADCTTGRIAHYFNGRDDLLIASLRMAHDQAGARMRAIADRESAPLPRLRAILLEALPLDDRRHREWKVWLSFWAAAIGSPHLAAENTRRYQEWAQGLCMALKPLVKKSQIEEHAQRLVTLIDGLGVSTTLNPSPAARAYASAEVDAVLATLM